MDIVHISKFKKNKFFDKNDKVVLCHGVFDVLHLGHILHFQKAKKFGNKLVVSLTPDELVNKGPNRPYFKIDVRSKMLKNFNFIDLIIINNKKTAENVIKTLKPAIYAKGSDYKNFKDITGNIRKEINLLKKNGGKFIITNEQTFSSSNIINNYFDENQFSNEFIKKNKINLKECNKIIEKLSHLEVLLVGEVIIDIYNYVKVLGKSPKENVISTLHKESEEFFGGIVATANNISNFVKRVNLVCLIGDDKYKKLVKKNLNKNVNFIPITKSKSNTILKKRFIQKSNLHKFFQVQYMNDEPIDGKQELELKNQIKKYSKKSSLLVINDFGHGLVNHNVAKFIDKLRIFKSINVQTNSSNYGFNLLDKFKNIDFASIDHPEAELVSNIKSKDVSTLISKIKDKIKIKSIAITKGHLGAEINYNNKTINIPIMIESAIDTMGAGDAFFSIASIVSKVCNKIEYIGFMGNCCGGIASNIIGHKKNISKEDLTRFVETKLK